jgi:hypothetical protein
MVVNSILQITELNIDYHSLCNNIIEISKNIICNNFEYKKQYDGRLNSAILEKPFLDILKLKLKQKHSNINIEIPPPRMWYDIKINNIPINLKITNGGTDNVFNKKAILYTLAKNEEFPNTLNFTEWLNYIIKYSSNIEKIRDYFNEYHFLVIHKKTNNILFKSILDIINYKSNPSNILQVNWNAEFKLHTIDTVYTTYSNNIKILEVLKIIQQSLINEYKTKKYFIHFNIDELNNSNNINNTSKPKNNLNNLNILKRIKRKIKQLKRLK